MKAMNSKSNNLHANQQQSQILEDDNDHMEFNKDNDEIQEEDKERKSFEKQKRPLSYPSSHSNRKSLATLDLKIHEPVLSFIGLSLSCRVTKHQIQIFGGHPTSIFTVRVSKIYQQQEQPVEETWSLKLAISFVIQLVNDLSMKRGHHPHFPQLLMSLVEY